MAGVDTETPSPEGPVTPPQLLAGLPAGDDALIDAIDADLLGTWFTGELWPVLYTTICHHGGPIEASRWGAGGQLMDPAGCAEVARLRHVLLAELPIAQRDAPALPWTERLSHLHAGILMAADWLASSLTAAGDERLTLVRNTLNATGWGAWERRVKAAADLLVSPRPAQQAVLSDCYGRTPAHRGGPYRLREDRSRDREGTGGHRGWRCGEHLLRGANSRRRHPARIFRVAELVRAGCPDTVGRVVRAVPGMLDTDGGGASRARRPTFLGFGLPPPRHGGSRGCRHHRPGDALHSASATRLDAPCPASPGRPDRGRGPRG